MQGYTTLTRTLSGKSSKPSKPLNDKDGQIFFTARRAKEIAQTFQRGAEQATTKNLSKCFVNRRYVIDTGHAPTITEVTCKAIKSLKSGKSAGPDDIPLQLTTEMLLPLLKKI